MCTIVVRAALAAALASTPAAVHVQDPAAACTLARGTPADAAAGQETLLVLPLRRVAP